MRLDEHALDKLDHTDRLTDRQAEISNSRAPVRANKIENYPDNFSNVPTLVQDAAHC